MYPAGLGRIPQGNLVVLKWNESRYPRTVNSLASTLTISSHSDSPSRPDIKPMCIHEAFIAYNNIYTCKWSNKHFCRWENEMGRHIWNKHWTSIMMIWPNPPLTVETVHEAISKLRHWLQVNPATKDMQSAATTRAYQTPMDPTATSHIWLGQGHSLT